MCRKSSVLAVGNVKGEIMYFELKENKPHGTKDDPFSTYHIKNEGRSFQIPVHWHDELEIIYVKSGFLTVSISGENYIGTPGDAFVVSPGNLHFMGSQTGTVDYFTFLFPLEYISFCVNDMLDDIECSSWIALIERELEGNTLSEALKISTHDEKKFGIYFFTDYVEEIFWALFLLGLYEVLQKPEFISESILSCIKQYSE